MKCSIYSSSVPDKIASDKYGAQKFDVPYKVLSNLLDEDFTIKEISSLIGVSDSTMYRRMHDYDLRKHKFTHISEVCIVCPSRSRYSATKKY